MNADLESLRAVSNWNVIKTMVENAEWGMGEFHVS
jgi:hypothetical protein